MKNNPSSGAIAIISAILVALLSSVSFWVFSADLKTSVILFLIVAPISLVVFYLLLQFFIHRKIMMIYRDIYRFKAKDEKFINRLGSPGTDPIKNVSDEVMEFMLENKREISQLKEQERFRQEFLSNVSHELKTPVFSIQGYIHTLLDGALEDKNVNRRFLKKAEKGIDHLAELVEEITEISKLQLGTFKLKKEKFDLGILVQDVFDMVEQIAKEKNTQLHFSGTKKPVFVFADKHRINQVLTNLIVNGIKYGKNNGDVWVKCTIDNKKVITEVQDNGDGIDEQHLSRLFERFYRVDEHRNSEEGGSGLGLSIVKHIIEAHQESIEVHSEKGVGSVFEFSLERAK